MTNRVIRVATVEDIPALLKLAEKFVSESSYGMEFDQARSEECLLTLIAHPDSVVYVSDSVDGVIIASVVHDWCVKPVCYVEKMYVSLEARGTGIARVLVSSVINFAKMRDCSHIFASNHATLSRRIGTMFENLLVKNGFFDSGKNFVKVV